MHSTTKNKISFLQKYIEKQSKKWFQKHLGNVVGVRVDKKVSNNNVKSHYSIVFQVVNKLDEGDLTKGQLIPKSFNIRFPNGKIKHIPTDIQETGYFQFQADITDDVNNITERKTGTLGLLLTNGSDVFALTNYHVAAWGLFIRNITFYNIKSGRPQDNLQIDGVHYLLQVGEISDTIDAAFINLGQQPNANNILPDGNRIYNSGFVKEEQLISHQNTTVFIYTRSRKNGLSVLFKHASVPYNPPAHLNIHFNQLIALELSTIPGDSGGIVLSQSFAVIGIIVGADDLFTYAIPYFRIHDFLPLRII